MTDAPKPTLTEAEREDVTSAFIYESDVTVLLDQVARIKAAARREALLEAADWIESDHPNARGLLCAAKDIRGFAEIDVDGLTGKVLRVEALIERLRKSDDRTWVSNVAEEFDTALAEPERDEEGR